MVCSAVMQGQVNAAATEVVFLPPVNQPGSTTAVGEV
jgi:hypothetical protein